MGYIDLETNEILKLDDLRKQHVNTAFPTNGPSDAWLENNGYARVVMGKKPVVEDGEKAVLMEDQVELFDGQYQYKWLVRNKTQDEIDFENDEYKRLRVQEYKKLDPEGLEVMRNTLKYIIDNTSGLSQPDDFVLYMGKINDVKIRNPKPVRGN